MEEGTAVSMMVTSAVSPMARPVGHEGVCRLVGVVALLLLHRLRTSRLPAHSRHGLAGGIAQVQPWRRLGVEPHRKVAEHRKAAAARALNKERTPRDAGLQRLEPCTPRLLQR